MKLINLNPPPGRVLIGPAGRQSTNPFQYYWFLARNTLAVFPGYNGPEIFAPFTITDGGGSLPDTFIGQFLITDDPSDFALPGKITFSRPDLVQFLQGTVPVTPFLIPPVNYPAVFEPPFIPTPPFFAWSVGVEVHSRDLNPATCVVTAGTDTFNYDVLAFIPMTSISANPGGVACPANNVPGTVVYVINPLSLPLLVTITGQSGSTASGPPSVSSPFGPANFINTYTTWESTFLFTSVPVFPGITVTVTDPLTGFVYTIVFGP